VVSRLGRYLGTVVPSANGWNSFTDAELFPGLGFPYTVRAVASSGLLSTATAILTRTPDHRPDLIVASISWDPPEPKPGDEVHFTGTTANIGTAPTPDVTHGLTFSVNDKTVCWSDASHEPLAPGARRTLTANNGPNGKATWTCTEGTFSIKAIVDDFNRIEESNKNNNTLTVTLSVAKSTP
jgi:subtilase family serine protease